MLDLETKWFLLFCMTVSECGWAGRQWIRQQGNLEIWEIVSKNKLEATFSSLPHPLLHQALILAPISDPLLELGIGTHAQLPASQGSGLLWAIYPVSSSDFSILLLLESDPFTSQNYSYSKVSHEPHGPTIAFDYSCFFLSCSSTPSLLFPALSFTLTFLLNCFVLFLVLFRGHIHWCSRITPGLARSSGGPHGQSGIELQGKRPTLCTISPTTQLFYYVKNSLML